MHLSVMPERTAIVRLGPQARVPDWATGPAGLSSVTRTPGELSLVVPEAAVPEGLVAQRGWVALRVDGPLDLSLVGILAELAVPLADAGVSIFAVSTYDTDYILVKDDTLQRAVDALEQRGHEVSRTARG